MKVYDKEGKVVNADKNQIEILMNAGWTKTKPELIIKEELKKDTVVKAIPKVKKSIRKISSKV